MNLYVQYLQEIFVIFRLIQKFLYCFIPIYDTVGFWIVVLLSLNGDCFLLVHDDIGVYGYIRGSETNRIDDMKERKTYFSYKK